PELCSRRVDERLGLLGLRQVRLEGCRAPSERPHLTGGGVRLGLGSRVAEGNARPAHGKLASDHRADASGTSDESDRVSEIHGEVCGSAGSWTRGEGRSPWAYRSYEPVSS